MKTEYSTSKIKKTSFIFSESKSLMSGSMPEKPRAIFICFLIPIVVLGVCYAINSVIDIIEFYSYSISFIGKTAIVILKVSICFFIIIPLVSEIFILCHRIAKGNGAACGIEYYKSLYFFFGLLIRSIFTAVCFVLSCFSNTISYEIASRFCVDDKIIFPCFLIVNISILLMSFQRLASFSLIFYLFTGDTGITIKKAKNISRRMLNGHFCEALIIYARFIPWIILSVSTLGILFIYFIPRYLVTKSLFFRYIYSEKEFDLKKQNLSYNKRTTEVKANEI